MEGRAAKAKYTFTDTQILDTEIGWDVMSDWEDPIMVKHAEVVTKNGGDILEFGFGYKQNVLTEGFIIDFGRLNISNSKFSPVT